ncbi:uncharacterized protein LOC120106782 [Phoenix dactylifera]|uniref:Uncharacterized protein LOC120106782 n=1 Tax=Phoenix dactylifera TaxID=42345 RepID=A0A8B8ZQZ3_PHODC|nr:uncharacterized protein LOC120106782 [Phoenix dactylifera]
MEEVEDRRVWRLTSRTTVGVRDILTISEGSVTQQMEGDWIWSLRVLPRIALFMWKVAWGCLPTRSILAQQGMRISSTCGSCSEVKTIYHVLIEYPRASQIWRSAGVHFDQGQRWLSIEEFLLFLEESASGPGLEERGTRAAYLVYYSWLDRNVRVFKSSSTPPRVVAARALLHATEFTSAAEISPTGLARDIWGLLPALVGLKYVFVSWVPPRPAFLKVNFDGSVADDERRGSAAFVIRDHESRLVTAGG